MFDSARLKLTAWYVLILMSVSLLFSAAFYQVSTREIQLLIDRIEYDELHTDQILFKRPHLPPHILSLEELYEVKTRVGINLMIINIGILLVAGGASYFLAGKTLQPIQAMLDEQNQFISDASHELRTPIATLRAEMEAALLEKKLSNTQARALITSNLEELDTLQQLSNKLLLLAQTPAGNQTQIKERVKIYNLLQRAVKKVSPLAREKQITITTQFAPLAASLVLCTESELTEVFVILLDNAIKYSPTATTITVTGTITKSKVVIRIQDQGIGIDQAEQKHIFKRFYRADKSRSQAEGYGLGLAIAHKIVTKQQGTISVASAVNKGSTFTVELPLAS